VNRNWDKHQSITVGTGVTFVFLNARIANLFGQRIVTTVFVFCFRRRIVIMNFAFGSPTVGFEILMPPYFW
jgi:hypothetical protein